MPNESLRTFAMGATQCGGAGGVRHHVMGRGVVLVLVDSEHQGYVLTLRRRRDDDLLCAALKVARGLVGIGEDSRGLDDDFDALAGPLQVCGITL